LGLTNYDFENDARNKKRDSDRNGEKKGNFQKKTKMAKKTEMAFLCARVRKIQVQSPSDPKK